jgi:hypothetical protein
MNNTIIYVVAGVLILAFIGVAIWFIVDKANPSSGFVPGNKKAVGTMFTGTCPPGCVPTGNGYCRCQ